MQEILGLCFVSMWDIVSSNPDRVYSLVTVLLHKTSLTSYIFFFLGSWFTTQTMLHLKQTMHVSSQYVFQDLK